MNKRFICLLLSVLVATTLGVSPLVASEAISKARDSYRRTTLAELVAESQSEKNTPHRAPHQYSNKLSDHFAKGSGSPFELEPVGPSHGNVVGA
ncbi:MAG TPA: hypothetical protein PLO78_05490 [Candidatus Omnitrophota bacterium]|nr:hypothetical protein [Candidatus Omnitrophota bacterium]